VDVPETRYSRTPDGTSIAFQVFGSGPADLLLIPGYFTNVDENWRMPEIASAHRHIASFARVILMDRRGVGLSDRLGPESVAPLETHVGDVVSVLDEVRASSIHVVASETGAALALLFAAMHPTRVRSLALYAPLMFAPARVYEGATDPDGRLWGIDHPWGSVGYAQEDLEQWAPSVAGDAEVVHRWAAYLRSSGSPSSADAMYRLHWASDVRDLYPSIHVPTQLLYRPRADPRDWIGRTARDAADTILDASIVELPGRDVPYWWDGSKAFIDAVSTFVTGSAVSARSDDERVLTTVLFTDIVNSTDRAAELGDRAWTELLARHHQILRSAIEEHRGVEIDTAGDGFLATFDGPARAVRAGGDAAALVTERLGLQIRMGVHTGEVQFHDGMLTGLAVHIGARVAAEARPSEMLVSSTVKDLVAGSGLIFEDAGEHELKGVPDHWHLYRVMP